MRSYKLITYFVITFSFTILFLTQCASAVSCSAQENTGATQDVCNRVSCPKASSKICYSKREGKYVDCSYQYGAIFFTGGWDDENSWPAWDGSSSLDFSVRGQVFCCVSVADGYVKANDLSIKYSGTDITLNGSSLSRSCSGSSDSWGPRSSDRLKATVSADMLNKASCDSGNPATCKLTVRAYSRMGTKDMADYDTYIVFKKQKIEKATFKSDGVSASSTQMSKSGDTFTGNGKDTSYKVRVKYVIKRTNDAPKEATSGYGTKKNQDSASYPSSASATTAAKEKNETAEISKDYDVEVPNGSTVKYCFGIKFDTEVTYKGGSRSSGNYSGTDYACYNFYNPAKNDTHFVGTIPTTASTGLTLNASASTATGDGLRNSFSITPTYTITRLATDGNPTNASSNYAYNAANTDNDNNYPAASAAKTSTGGLKKGGKKEEAGSASSFTLNIGASAITRCFYLRYDANVTYYDSARDDDSADFAGKTKQCFTITNPPAYYTATFGNGENKATSAGTLDSHSQLTRTESNTMGRIDHATRTTGNTTDPYENGRFDDSTYPKKSDGTADDQYTATFTHTVTRTDTKPTDTVNKIYAPSAKVSWQVQYSINGGTNWSNYTTSDDKDGSSATVSGESTLTDAGTKTITVHPKWTMNASNAGKYLYYCQRLAYTSTSVYKSKTPDNNANTYETVFDHYGDTAYTTAACVTLRNPLWREYQSGDLEQHDIHVSGTTTAINPTGARLINAATSSTAYETTAVNSSFAFDHSLTRTDSGFDETDIGRSDFETSVNPAFFHPTIYNNCNYAVTTSMWGSEHTHDPSGHDSDTGTDLIYAKRSTEGTACNRTTKLNAGVSNGLVNGYEVQLNAASKTDTSTNRWFSSVSDGRTTTCFHASLTGFPSSNYPCRSDRSKTSDGITATVDASWETYQLLAGETKQFSQGTYNTRSDWYVRYKHIQRCEDYTSGYNEGYRHDYPSCAYDRTEVVDTSPVLKSTPVYSDSASSATTYSLFRPYNYVISSIRPVSTPSSPITYAGQNVKRSFTVSVDRYDTTKSYLTDLYQPNTYVIGYRILPGQDRTGIQAATVGGANIPNSGNPQTDLCTNFYGTANRLGFGADTNRCSILVNSDSPHPAKVPAEDNNTVYNHVYDDTSHSLTYATSDIYVPNNLAVGEKYCIAIAVENYSTNPATGFANSNYFISSSTCSNIAKLPSVNVWSGSVKTNGGVKTSTSYSLQADKTYLTYGSWADFAIIANGDLAKMASAASIAQGVTQTTREAILCNTDHLTIANSMCAGTSEVKALGNSKVISESTVLEKLRARYVEGRAESTLIRQDTLTATDVASKGLNPTSFFSSHPLVVYSTENLIVSTDLILEPNRTFSQNFTPQIILIAEQDIKIDQNVTHLDAWLVAGGHIDTCTNGNDTIALSGNVCGNQLTIRGAILASSISFNRTHGGDANQGTTNTPAEIVKYSPATLLFSAREAERALLPETTYLHKLPVRY